MTANGYGVPFQGDENVLELAVMVAQLREYTKITELYTLNVRLCVQIIC